MSIAESLLPEIDQETATTKRVLERVPEDKLSWKPHEKSFSLGQLALHVATTPGNIANLVTADEVELPASFEQSEAQSKEEMLAAHEESVAKAKQYLSGLSDEAAMATWRVVSGGNEVMAAPRIGMIRSLMLNHWYHHRGQLSVYLRLLNVPVPPIYGPTADENPFAPH